MLMSGSKREAAAVMIAAGLLCGISNPAEAAVQIEGQVQAGRGAVNGSTVTLWAASADAPARLAQATTGADGSFAVSVDQVPDGSILYLVATGGTPSAGKQGGNNPAIALLAVLGGKPLAHVVVNEFTTVASVVTATQFIDGTALKGPPLALRIAAGNVPHFADIATGGLGTTIQDPLNSSQTTTLAGFATLADLPKGDATKGRILGRIVNGKPVDGTLQVTGPFHLAVDQQDRIWVTNGGSNTVTRFPASDPGKAEQITVGYGPRAVAIDSLGNAWVANTVGHPGIWEKVALVWNVVRSKLEEHFGSASKADDEAKQWIGLYELVNRFPGGDVSMVRPDGTVLASFDGGTSIVGPWGVAIDGNDNVWVANAIGHSIALLCGARPANCPPGLKTGDPISPRGGYIGGLERYSKRGNRVGNAEGSRKKLPPLPFVGRPTLRGDARARLQRGHSLSAGIFDAIRLAVGGEGSD